MKSTIVFTLLGLAATSMAAAVAERATNTTIQVTLCNDFHGGKPCESKSVEPGVCGNVDSKLYKYISSVKIPATTEVCKFFNEKDCEGQSITVKYPGDVDLAVNDSFDNEIASFSCVLLEGGY